MTAREFIEFDFANGLTVSERRLPHWQQDGVMYFITFRLADSIPQAKLNQWRYEHDIWRQKHPEPCSAEERREYYEHFPRRLQEWLDNSYGTCLLRDPALAEIVGGVLKHFDGTRYVLDDWVVMPNHVHLLVQPQTHTLSQILHSWKSFSATAINKVVNARGKLWQEESAT